mgnify:CR=1 FL=1
MSFSYTTIRQLLFCLDPETAHSLTVRLLGLAAGIPAAQHWMTRKFDMDDPCLETEVFGLRFRNSVGIAAGYDKNALAAGGLAALGAGHVEIGTITPLPQSGNRHPRLFRLPAHEALINRMGFPNAGAKAIASRLTKLRARPIHAKLGINIGKGHTTLIEKARVDYSLLLRRLHPYADYLAVNVSSPNTLGLRQLQAKEALGCLMEELMQAHRQVCSSTPILVKIGPDLSLAEVDDVLEVILHCGASGVIATNTTSTRMGICRPDLTEKGGLSGTPLRDHSTEIIRYIYRQTGGKLPIIGVGGVNSTTAALEKIRAGASLVQVYTGLVYRGPSLLRVINAGILQEMDNLGVSSLMQLVGSQT